jgi:hypothetical protein
MGYVDELLKKNCYSQLHPLFVRCNNPAKEISESMAAFKHLSKLIKFDGGVTNFHIGDGRYCRTGALFSFLTKSINVSIDPIINVEEMKRWIVEEGIRDNFEFNAIGFQGFEFLSNEKIYNLVCVHSHVDLVKLVKKFLHWQYLYTNPCCKPKAQVFTVQFMEQNNISVVLAGIDAKILSEKNEVFIYKNNRE